MAARFLFGFRFLVSFNQTLILNVLSIGGNLLEGIPSIGAGSIAGGVALIGFGFDSMIEVSSGTVLLWRLHIDASEKQERAEQIASTLVGICFLLLAAYIGFDAAKGCKPKSSEFSLLVLKPQLFQSYAGQHLHKVDRVVVVPKTDKLSYYLKTSGVFRRL